MLSPPDVFGRGVDITLSVPWFKDEVDPHGSRTLDLDLVPPPVPVSER